MSEMLVCAECGRECPRADMYGAPGDKRCEPCAKEIGKRLDPTRTHSVAQASTGTRKARQRRQNLILGGVLGVGILVAWLLPSRSRTSSSPDGNLDGHSDGRVAGGRAARVELTPQIAFFARYPFAPSTAGPDTPLRTPDELAACLPSALAGWTERSRATGRSAPRAIGKSRPSSWALIELARTDENVVLRIVDGGRPSADDQRAFRDASNATYVGLQTVEHRVGGAWVRVRTLISHRFWVDATGPGRAPILLALAAIDRPRLSGLAKR